MWGNAFANMIKLVLSMALPVFLSRMKKGDNVCCHTVLSRESMKPSKLKWHLETLHKEYREKTRSFFRCLKEEFLPQQMQFKRAISVSDQAQKTSFEVSYCIAQAKKPHTNCRDFWFCLLQQYVEGNVCGNWGKQTQSHETLQPHSEVKEWGNSCRSGKRTGGAFEKHRCFGSSS